MANENEDLIKALRALAALAALMESAPPQARRIMRSAIRDQLRKEK